jgi:hypothetical protein
MIELEPGLLPPPPGSITFGGPDEALSDADAFSEILTG